jgi:DNA (cytosine-5)-methyltransferase 1
MQEIRYIDLFCGLGAFHEAFKKHSEFKCVFACDINQKVGEIYEANHGLKPLGDIKNVDASSIPDFDILCAGFPCQPFSIAGSKLGFGDDRGNLFYDILRIVDAKRPRMAVLENVKNLKTHDQGRTYKTIKDSFEERGYKFFSKVMDSSHHGSPQCRQRIFMIATTGDFVFPERSPKQCVVSSILDRSDVSCWDGSRYYLVAKSSRPRPFKPRILFNIFSNEKKKGGRQGERIYDAGCCGVTICASSGGPGAKTGLYKVGENVRRLNVGECLRMFGFPPDFNFLDAGDEQKIFYLGNSIVVNVVDALIPAIKKNFETEHPSDLPAGNLYTADFNQGKPK